MARIFGKINLEKYYENEKMRIEKPFPNEDRDEYSEHTYKQWTEEDLFDAVEDLCGENTTRIRQLRRDHQIIGSYIYELDRRNRCLKKKE